MGIFGKNKKGEVSPKLSKKDEPAAEPKKTEAAKKAEPIVRGPLVKEGFGQSHRILVRPVSTEKASRLQALGKYEFIVAKGANKNEVAQAVRDLYGVKPVSVRMISGKGKFVRFGRFTGKEKDFKKALVTLKAGDSLTVTEA